MTGEDLEVLSRRLDMATRAARIAVWEWDPVSNSLYWSPVFMQIIGIEPCEFRGHISDFMERLVPESRELVENALDAHFRHGTPYDIEYEMFHKSGRRVAIAAKGEASFDADDRPIRMIGTVQDISDRRSLENRLLQAERIARIGHWIVDVENNKLSWSPQTYRIHGLEPDSVELDVETALGFYHPEDRDIVAEAFGRVLEDGQFRELNARLVRPDGDVRYVHIDGVAELTAGGRAERLFGIVHDRTDLVKKERELEHVRRLEAIGKLAGGVAHDFNNLLTVILGNLELVRDGRQGSWSDEDVGLIDEAVRAISRGRDLTQALLSFAGTAPLRPEPISAAALLSDLKKVLHRTMPASLSLAVDGSLSTRSIIADRGNLEACLINLVLNARDAIVGHGAISLSARDIDIDDARTDEEAPALPAGAYVAFSVQDDGRGIPTDDMHRIFEPFFSTKPVGKGSGLGLARVKGFAEQSRGTVRVDSEVGKGSCVTMYLPAAVVAPTSEDFDTPDDAPEIRRLNVLLVEDLEPVRRVLKAGLERAGHRVIAASNASEALSLFAHHPEIEIVLSDVVMPGAMQGPDLVREIRQRRREIRAVFMSGYSGKALKEDHGIATSDECLSKPVTTSELSHAMLRAMKNR